ncbi:MAG: hypothetical protein IMZ53_10915 [Thermoplasmata archaeon]|nr:hypothetical protein [Thermoplasmata archaeon]MBE3141078.1 hypothetical protein [Thermoplasmata archaeon]
MALRGHVKKEIERKVRNCVIEDGLSPEKCVEQIEEHYELDKDDRLEILEMAKGIGKMK